MKTVATTRVMFTVQEGIEFSIYNIDTKEEILGGHYCEGSIIPHRQTLATIVDALNEYFRNYPDQAKLL